MQYKCSVNKSVYGGAIKVFSLSDHKTVSQDMSKYHFVFLWVQQNGLYTVDCNLQNENITYCNTKNTESGLKRQGNQEHTDDKLPPKSKVTSFKNQSMIL